MSLIMFATMKEEAEEKIKSQSKNNEEDGEQ
jgi:hypothetical protein